MKRRDRKAQISVEKKYSLIYSEGPSIDFQKSLELVLIWFNFVGDKNFPERYDPMVK